MAEGEAETDPRLPLQDVPEIRTRKAADRPAHPAQAAYIERCRGSELVFGVGPAGTGKTYLAVAQARRPAAGRPGRPHRAVPPGGRGRRAPGLPARRHEGEGRPLSAPALRRAARHAAGGAGGPAHRQRRDRDRAARLHARPHAGACLRHPRRSAEHHAGADEDVPDPHGRGYAHGDHRRSDPDRSAARAAVRPDRRAAHAGRACRASAWPASTSGTWCAIRWWRRSSRPTSGPMPRLRAAQERCAEQQGRRGKKDRMEPGSRRLALRGIAAAPG